MRLAVLIITLCLTAILSLQSCAVSVGDNLLQQRGGGSVGILMALLFVIGAALVMGLPSVSIAVFAIAGLFGISTGSTTSYTGLTIWGGVALVLAVMSYFGSRELSEKRRVPVTDGD